MSGVSQCFRLGRMAVPPWVCPGFQAYRVPRSSQEIDIGSGGQGGNGRRLLARTRDLPSGRSGWNVRFRALTDGGKTWFPSARVRGNRRSLGQCANARPARPRRRGQVYSSLNLRSGKSRSTPLGSDHTYRCLVTQSEFSGSNCRPQFEKRSAWMAAASPPRCPTGLAMGGAPTVIVP